MHRITTPLWQGNITILSNGVPCTSEFTVLSISGLPCEFYNSGRVASQVLINFRWFYLVIEVWLDCVRGFPPPSFF